MKYDNPKIPVDPLPRGFLSSVFKKLIKDKKRKGHQETEIDFLSIMQEIFQEFLDQYGDENSELKTLGKDFDSALEKVNEIALLELPDLFQLLGQSQNDEEAQEIMQVIRETEDELPKTLLAWKKFATARQISTFAKKSARTRATLEQMGLGVLEVDDFGIDVLTLGFLLGQLYEQRARGQGTSESTSTVEKSDEFTPILERAFDAAEKSADGFPKTPKVAMQISKMLGDGDSETRLLVKAVHRPKRKKDKWRIELNSAIRGGNTTTINLSNRVSELRRKRKNSSRQSA